MNFLYLLESTALCGGVKVVFNHASALIEKGHQATVLSPEPYPAWINGNLPFYQLDLNLLPETPFFQKADVVIGTSPFHLLSLYSWLNNKGCCHPKLVHFVQGYEGDYIEAEPFMDMVTKAYNLDLVKITVSEALSQRLSGIYPGRRFMTCGQGLENEFFYPSDVHGNTCSAMVHQWDTVYVVGALDISIKRIADALKAFEIASKTKPQLNLVRISAVDTREKESLLLGNIDAYHVNIPPREVGELFRSKPGILLSPSSPGEGFGLPPLEAMACGVPVVLTDIPSYRSFSIDQDYALFVPVGAPEKMAEALLKLLDDRALRDQLIKSGMAVADKYKYTKVIERLEACLLNE